MSDDTFLIVVAVAFGVVVVGIYAGLRILEEKHRESVEKWRRLFATYSVPIIIAIMVLISLYHSQMGFTCNAAGHNTAGWTCDLSWLLLPVLIVSASISYHYWRVYRRGRDILTLAGEDPSTWSKRWRYSKTEIVALIVIALVGLLAVFF